MYKFFSVFLLLLSCRTVEQYRLKEPEISDYMVDFILQMPQPPEWKGLESPQTLTDKDRVELKIFLIEYKDYLRRIKRLKDEYLKSPNPTPKSGE